MIQAFLLSAALFTGPAQPAQPLAGPEVVTRGPRQTLVSRDFNNRLRRPETTPEVAALELLDLPPAIRAAADEVVAARTAAIDRFVSENLLLLGEIDTASKAGRKLEAAALLLKAVQALAPALEGGPLAERIARALPPEHAAKYRAICDEYWNAAIDEALATARADGQVQTGWQAGLGERLRHFGEEIARSYERQAAAGTLFIDFLLAGLDLTPEQRGIIGDLKIDMLERTGMRPSEQDQGRLALGILAYLNPAQRRIVLDRIAGL